VACVSAEYGVVGWHTVMRAVRGHGQPLVEDPVRLDGVRAVGVDETAFLAATGARHTVFVTGIVDLTGRPSPPVVVRDLAGVAVRDVARPPLDHPGLCGL
jgi:hypothetical protein